MDLKSGLSAVVTGGGSGLGEASARALAAKGVAVSIFDLDEERARHVADEIEGAYAVVDVSDASSVAAGFAAVRARNGAERIMVNCAGIATAAKTVSRGEAHDPALFEKALKVNLLGTFNCASQAALSMTDLAPLNADGERGVIVNTASVAAFDGQIGQVAYASSKAGVVGLTLPMARDLAKSGIRVAAIAPGLFATPMLKSLPEDVQEALGAQVPFPARLGQAQEFAGLVSHIAENAMLNGEVIRLDGAIRMAPK